jgi:hypothetical protein
MDPLDRDLIADWIEVVGMVTEYSEQFRAQLMRVFALWLTIHEPLLRYQGLREMDAILTDMQILIRAELPDVDP